MSVVNVKVKYIRPKYQNLKEWMQDPDNVYIGRRGIVFIDGQRFPKENSVWCNPFKVGRDGTREEVCEKFNSYIRHKVVDEDLMTELLALGNKNLGCWCAPESCHGDVLLKLIKQINDSEDYIDIRYD